MPETRPSITGVALQQPETVAALDRLSERVDALTRMMESIDPLVEKAPDLIAGVTDAADEAYSRAAASGIDLDARVHDVMRLVEKLTEPRTMELFSTLLGRMDQLERLLQLADQAPGLVAMLVDSLDEMAERARESGVDFERGLANGAAAAVRFGAVMGEAEVRALETVLHSGVLAPETVRLMGGLGEALSASAATDVGHIGPLGLLRALRDPDARRTLGFAAVFARQFGQRLNGGTPATQPDDPSVTRA
jgi:hypothetical protein